MFLIIQFEIISRMDTGLATLLDTALDLETELGTFTRYGTESKE
jgi:hypothetical protein